MECPRCENDVDGTASFCPECGLNFDEIRQKLGLTDGAPADTGDNTTTANDPAIEDELARHSKNARSSGGAAGQAGGTSTQQPGGGRRQPAQESGGMLTRRRLVFGGVAAAGIGLWQTGNLEWVLGGSSDWPVPSGVERVSLTEAQKNRVRSQIGSQDAQVRVYTTTQGDPLSYYQAESVDGWQHQSSFSSGGTFRKDDQGLLVVVQERGQFIDLDLPSRTPTPTDVILVKGDWPTISQ